MIRGPEVEDRYRGARADEDHHHQDGQTAGGMAYQVTRAGQTTPSQTPHPAESAASGGRRPRSEEESCVGERNSTRGSGEGRRFVHDSGSVASVEGHPRLITEDRGSFQLDVVFLTAAGDRVLQTGLVRVCVVLGDRGIALGSGADRAVRTSPSGAFCPGGGRYCGACDLRRVKRLRLDADRRLADRHLFDV